MAADAVLVRLHGQDEGRDANGDGVDQAQLRGRIGIGEREDERGDREDEGEDVLDQIERSAALDVVDDAAALRHDRRHGREIGVQQDDVRRLTGDGAAGGHCDGAVGFAQGKHVVDAVASHGDGMARGLHGLHELLFLVGCDAAEDRAALGGLRELLFGLKRARVNIILCTLDPGAARDLGDRERVVAGDNLDGDALTGEVGERIGRGLTDLVGEQDERERQERRGGRVVIQTAFVESEEQYAAAFGRELLHLTERVRRVRL